MIEILESLAAAPWPVWVGVGGLVVLRTLARLVCERARRRTYREILVNSAPGTLLVDLDGRRSLVLRRTEFAPRGSTIVASGRFR